MKIKQLNKLIFPAGVKVNIPYDFRHGHYHHCGFVISSSPITGTYKISRQYGDAAYVTLTTEIIINGYLVTVPLDTSTLQDGSPAAQATGDFVDELILEQDGVCIYAARRDIRLEDVIS